MYSTHLQNINQKHSVAPPKNSPSRWLYKEEQMEFRSIIFGNILQSALAIIRGMEMLDINFGSPAGQVCKTAPKHKNTILAWNENSPYLFSFQHF